MAEKKEFRERLGNDIKSVKRMIYKEEFKSFISAAGFAANVACLTLFPLSGISILNMVAIWFCMKQFKPTVKKQIMYHKHLEFLSKIKEEKVWTQGDK